MHIQTAKCFNKEARLRLLAKNGVFLAQRSSADHTILLFGLFNYYAEVYYNDTEREIGYIRMFHDTADLEPYLDMIDLGDLLFPDLN